MKIKYSILTPSKMKVTVDDKREVYITGEGTTEPKFYADIISIKKWEPPFDNEEITEEVKTQIIKVIENDSKKRKVSVVFE